MRLFVAATVPEAIRTKLMEAQRALAGLPFPVRWVKPETIHLTFFFLGEVGESREHEVREAISRVAISSETFGLRARGVGVFPPRGRPRVIWAGIEGDLEAAARMKQALDAALGACGFAAEARPFRPHLTLGRVGPGRSGGSWAAMIDPVAGTEFGRFEVSAMILFESRLTPQGATYRTVSEAPLRAHASSGVRS